MQEIKSGDLHHVTIVVSATCHKEDEGLPGVVSVVPPTA